MIISHQDATFLDSPRKILRFFCICKASIKSFLFCYRQACEFCTLPGRFDDNLPKGSGRYRFDKGCELFGEYTVEEQLIQGNNDEDEPVLVTRPKWVTNGRMATLT